MNKIKEMTERIATGRIALGLLSTCGAKGLTAALLYDMSDKFMNTAHYLNVSAIVTGILGTASTILWLTNLNDSDSRSRRSEDLEFSKIELEHREDKHKNQQETCAHDFEYRHVSCNCKKCGAHNGVYK